MSHELEGDLLERVPWALHGKLQDKAALRRTLRNEAERYGEQEGAPLISLVVDPGERGAIADLVASCRLSSWPHWELLIPTEEELPRGLADDARVRAVPPGGDRAEALNRAIAASKGQLVGIVGRDGLLHPQVMGAMAHLFGQGRTVLSCNEVTLERSTLRPTSYRVGSGLDAALLARGGGVSRLVLVARSALDAIAEGGGPFRASSGDVELDLLLRISDTCSGTTTHLPVFGYYGGPARDDVARIDAKRRAIDAHLARSPAPYELAPPGARDGNRLFSVHFAPQRGSRLGVVVPYRDGWEVTSRCLDSLERQETGLTLEVVLVDNRSRDEGTARGVDLWLRQTRRHRYTRLSYDGAFNFAKINNFALKELSGRVDLVLFLNNDVELQSPKALDAMAGEAQRDPMTAFVGVRLDYPDGGLQHGGLKIVATGEGLGFFRSEHMRDATEYVHDEHPVPAVTFACALCRRDVWERLGGLEEHLFPNGLGDLDICLRAHEAGYRNVYLGTVRGIHHESRTRLANSEELEHVHLNERHGSQLAHWRTRTLAERPAGRETNGVAGVQLEAPLRHRIADRINDVVKALGGPWHRRLKRLLSEGT